MPVSGLPNFEAYLHTVKKGVGIGNKGFGRVVILYATKVKISISKK
jgi:hypothetical protein